jgi:molybdopterin-guanine dinucleotide biosynthesis protein A
MILGAVLVGGHSTRMGRDKAGVVVDGVAMVDRARAVVADVCDDVVTVGGVGCDVVDDRAHPMGGILALLREKSAHRYVIAAVDQPLLKPSLLQLLLAACVDDDDGVCFDGEPLPMVLGHKRRHTAGALVAAGALRLSGLITKTLPLDEEQRRSLMNVNHPDDVVAADAASRAAPPLRVTPKR